MSTDMKRTTRICTVDTDHEAVGHGDVVPIVGSTVCLIEWEDIAHRQPVGEVHTFKGNRITTNPRTNQGRQELWNGWLGTTNDIVEYARGAWRVVSIQIWDRTEDGERRYSVSLAKATDPA